MKRNVPSKKQLFDYEFIYRKSIYEQIPNYEIVVFNGPDAFSNEIGRISSVAWYSDVVMEKFDENLVVEFFQKYHNIIDWYLVDIYSFEFFLKRFKENPIPMKFKRHNIVYEFGRSYIKRFIYNCLNILPFIPNLYIYFYIKKVG